MLLPSSFALLLANVVFYGQPQRGDNLPQEHVDVNMDMRHRHFGVLSNLLVVDHINYDPVTSIVLRHIVLWTSKDVMNFDYDALADINYELLPR